MSGTPSDSHDQQAALALIGALCEETISPQQMQELERLIEADVEVRRLYIRMMHLHACLYRHAAVLGTARPSGIWRTLVTTRMIAAAMVLAVGLGLCVAWLHSRHAKAARAYAAVLTNAVDADWGSVDAPQETGDGFSVGQSGTLRSGCVELTFGSGCRMVVEGPAEFTAVSGTQMDLKRGSISATKIGGGFIVTSPTGVIRDLGTRFGVAVAIDGSTEVDVFEGRVTAALRQADGKTTHNEVVLYEGQAVRVSKTDVKFDPVGAIPQRFVNHLGGDVKALDLVDLISGGDGTTRRRGTAIDTTTGRFGMLSATGPRPGTAAFRPVSSLTVVDGCFVPDGSKGDMAVDSNGDRFRFPASSGISINSIWTGGIIPWFRPVCITTVLNRVDYSTPDHSLLCIHSNNGLTLDLESIRRLHPERNITTFHCLIGNSYVNGYNTETGLNPLADVFVLVDGKSRFEKRRFTNQAGVFDVSISLARGDRFVTLATTDGGDGINDDWILWADPVLNVAAR